MARGRVDIYVIPPNFAEEGTLFSGRVKARNAVETVFLVSLLLRVLLWIDISSQAKIYAGVIVIIPATVFALLGVQGESLSSFIFHFFCFLKKRRVLSPPTGRHRLERNRRLRKRRKDRRNRRTRGGGEDRYRSRRIEEEAKRGKTAGKTRQKKRKDKAKRRTRRAKKEST